MSDELQRLAIFQDKQVRKTLRLGEWWFVIVDVIAVLTDSTNPAQYLKNLRQRDEELAQLLNAVDKGGVQIEPPLTLAFRTEGGKQRLLCWNTEGLFRLIQSISSPKAEPFKLWLAKVGYARVQEIEDPELAQTRIRDTYRAKGYSDDWIEKRVRGIQVRDELTNEWKQRGVKEGREYGILTSEISQATFGIKPSEYKQLKGLKRENLRDHMTDLELIFSMLGEASTTEIARVQDARGFEQNKDAAVRGGGVAGRARNQLEKETGQKVINDQNYLPEQTNLDTPPQDSSRQG